MSVLVRAPSNIALLKYMGKLPGDENLAENPSLSLTLRELCTVVELSSTSTETRWMPEPPRGISAADFRYPLLTPELSTAAAEKFIAHVDRFYRAAPAIFRAAKLTMREPSAVEIRSANTFPHSSGIASSASSFAALTFALFIHSAGDRVAAAEKFQRTSALRVDLARVSRKGSGSSCRSFFGPFTEWNGEEVTPVDTKLPPLVDFVCVLSETAKSVSSSEAHRRVKTSPRWHARLRSAASRFVEIRALIQAGHFKELSPLVSIEALEMHELFHTAAEAFRYITPETEKLWAYLTDEVGARVLLTLDAGPNIHVICSAADAPDVRAVLRKYGDPPRILEDEGGVGPEWIRGENSG